MALSSATITYDISDKVGVDFDARRTKVWVSTNIPGEVIADTVGNQIRVGDGLGDIADDGTGSVSVWVPGTGSNPTTWQTYIHFDYAQRRPGGARERLTFGPFTITTSANLADLIQEQEAPPTYLSTVTALLDGYVDDAEAAADASASSSAAAAASAAAASALILSDLGTTDGQTRALLQNPASQTAVAEAANIAAQVGGYDVILLAGQSNMQGADNTKDNAIDVTDSRIFVFASSGSSASTIVPAVEPLGHVPGAASTIGPGMPFARWYAARHPGRKILLVPCAYYSTGFENSNAPVTARWKAVGGTQDLRAFAIAQSNAAMSAAGPGAQFVGVLWCQGEADASISSPAATYQANELSLIDDFRSQITGAARSAFLILSMVPEGVAANAARQTIQGVHIDTPYLRERCGYAPGLTGHGVNNNVHYDSVAQRWNGSVALPNAYLRALGNVIGTAPQPPTDVTVTQDPLTPTAANVTWTSAPGRVTDYQVQYRTADGEAWATLTRSRSLAGSAVVPGVGLGNQLQVQVFTVNENGSSFPSPAAKVAMLATPALNVSQTAADTVALTSGAVAGASGYRFDYKLSSVSTWTIGTPQVGTSLSISGLNTAAPYDFRVAVATIFGTAIKAATTFQLGVLPINPATLSSSFAQVYGMHKIVLGYSGSALRVRRSSDDTETDIGFVSNGLDTAAMLTFCGSGNGFVSKVYDQSGNGRDLAQSSLASQPQIVSAGAVVVHNGRPAMSFDGVDDFLSRSTANLWAAGSATVCAVASGVQNTVGSAQQCIIGEGNTASNNPIYMLNKSNGGKFGFIVLSDATSDNVVQDLNNTADAATFIPGSPQQFSFVDSGSDVKRYRGGTAMLAGTRSYSRAGKTLTLNRQAVGSIVKNVASLPATMLLSDLVVFYAAISDPDRAIVEANQRAYYGTPTGL